MTHAKALAGCLFAVSAAIVQAQSFATIGVKAARSNSLESRRLRVLPSGDLIATSINAIGLIEFGYEVPANPSERLAALPDWVYSQRYDIEAKAPSGARRISPSDAINGDVVRKMFLRVLEERFHLVIRAEKKTMPAYAMVIAPGGAKLKRSGAADCIYDTAPTDGCHTFAVAFGHPLNGHAVTADDLAHYIENWTDLPVVNKTSLEGFFTTSSPGWLPMKLPPPPPNGAANADFTHLESIDAALKSLGLRLRKEDAWLPVFTVERIEKPSLDQ
jgi:uncharacterized protein (TIGR03435 family)